MNSQNLLEKLEHIKTPEVRTSRHQRQLKAVLMASAHFKKARTWAWLPQYAPLGALALVGLVIIGVGQYSPSSPVPPVALVDDWELSPASDMNDKSTGAPGMFSALGQPS